MFFCRSHLLTCLVACATLATALPAFAQKAEPQKRARVDDPVLVFNRVCYARIPDLSAIRDMATKLAWQPIQDGDLKQFTQIADPDVLEGWDAQVGERVFRTAIVQSRPPESMAKTFADFKNGTATTCTMVLDEGYPAQVISQNMQALAKRDPIAKDIDEGLLSATTWAGGNDKLKVFLISKVAKHGRGGVLSVTVLQK